MKNVADVLKISLAAAVLAAPVAAQQAALSGVKLGAAAAPTAAPSALAGVPALAAPAAQTALSALGLKPALVAPAPVSAAANMTAAAQAVAAIPALAHAPAASAAASGRSVELAMTGGVAASASGAPVLAAAAWGDGPAPAAHAALSSRQEALYGTGATPELKAAVAQMQSFHTKLMAEVRKVMVGQEDMINAVAEVFYAREHALLLGMPGVAKTQAIKAFADGLGLVFKRIQGAPDVQPADIVGSNIIEEDPATGKKNSRFVPGPVFANIVLTDELNRMPPKTNSAQLEANAEGQVTVDGLTRPVPQPYTNLATMNPIEQEGTYHVPEAGMDRYMYLIKVPYPTAEDLLVIMDRFSTKEKQPRASQVAHEDKYKSTEEEYVDVARTIEQIWVDPSLKRYIVDIIMATHEPKKVAQLNLEEGALKQGASPRAAIAFLKAARARAFREGRAYVLPRDIQGVAPLIMRHRMTLGFGAPEPDTIVKRILEIVKVPVPAALSGEEVPSPAAR